MSCVQQLPELVLYPVTACKTTAKLTSSAVNIKVEQYDDDDDEYDTLRIG